jgi:hypothetical protein
VILPAWASDTQTVTVTIEIPQINWIKMEEQDVSVNSLIGFPSEADEFSYTVSATGRRPRVITARLEKPVPKGWRVILEMDPLEVGKPAGPVPLSLQEQVVMKNIWGIFNQKGNGKIKIETEMDAHPYEGNMNIIFAVKEGI